jgi:23S rRNA (guanosine2251-2'-O)-methyltransferase
MTLKEELIYGLNPVLEALRGNRRAFELFVAEGSSDRRMEKLRRLATEKHVPVRTREKKDITRICGSDLDDILTKNRESGKKGLLVVLDGIQDPHNLGALIRSAACAGAHGVIIPKDRAARITPAVEKASAGAVETVAVAQVVNVAQTLEELKSEGFWIYGAADSSGTSVYEQDFTGHTILVIGSEGEGIRPLVRRKCDVLMSIPMGGGISSLNASVAGGVILFEIVRQRLAEAVRKEQK